MRLSGKKTKRRPPALFSLGGAAFNDDDFAEFRRKYPDCPLPEPLEVLNLTMNRENAEAIASGRKTVEFRDCKPFYGSRIFDKRVMAWREAHKDDATISDYEFQYADPLRQVRRIHFYDTAKTFTLDVSVKETGLIEITDECIQMLHERFNCHEQDENLAILNEMHLPNDERPVLFYFVIDKILDNSL